MSIQSLSESARYAPYRSGDTTDASLQKPVPCTTDSRLLQRRYSHTTEILATTATLQAHYSTARALQHDTSLQHSRKVQCTTHSYRAVALYSMPTGMSL